MTEKEELELIGLCESKSYGGRPGRPRTIVCDVGVNDAPFVTTTLFNGKYSHHPAYSQWKNMVRRCRNAKEKTKAPTYIDCELDERWFSFMCFYKYWRTHYKHKFQIDKDILFVGNKIYSPDTCMMVPCWVNTIVGEKQRDSDLPAGVSYNKNRGKYVAQHTVGAKNEGLGYFADPAEAHKAWFKRKMKHLNEKKSELDEIDERIYPSLFLKIDSMRVSK